MVPVADNLPSEGGLRRIGPDASGTVSSMSRVFLASAVSPRQAFPVLGEVSTRNDAAVPDPGMKARRPRMSNPQHTEPLMNSYMYFNRVFLADHEIRGLSRAAFLGDPLQSRSVGCG